MTALVEILVSLGGVVTGSDVADQFYTDQILNDLGVEVFQGFNAHQVPTNAQTAIFSAAYDPNTHAELVRLKELNIPLVQYNQALGQLSRQFDSSGISGVHGKTTTTALAGVLVQALGLSGMVLTGSGVRNFAGRSVYFGGDDFFIAETCEYRRHFLAFSPNRIILTSLEEDHLDYYPTLQSIEDAFYEYLDLLPDTGTLIYCFDDPGAKHLAETFAKLRPKVKQMPYGFSAPGPGKITLVQGSAGEQRFTLGWTGGEVFHLRVPGNHTVLNAGAACLLVLSIIQDQQIDLSINQISEGLAKGLDGFLGTRRRSEIIGEAQGILVLDDYGHHPKAIATTLRGYKDFYPRRRLVVSFMSHTYSRTGGLLNQFAQSFSDADLVILHEIYASARETPIDGVSGQVLYEKTLQYHPNVVYLPNHQQALGSVIELLQPGDVFVTMGAGDNWKLGRKVLEYFHTQS